MRYITNQPALGVTEGTGELGFSSLAGGGLGNDAKLAVNVPLGSAAALRVAAYNTAIGGFIDAVQPDLSVRENVDDGRRTGARVAVLLQPSERLSFTPRLVYQDVSMNGWNRMDACNILANPFTTTRPAVSLENRQQFTQIDEPYTDRFVLGALTAEIDFGDVVLTQITSVIYRDVEVVRDASALGGSVSFSPFGAPEAGYTLDFPLVHATTAEGLTQEIRLAGEGERLDWVIGSFYGSSERWYGQSAYAKDYVAMELRGGRQVDLSRRPRHVQRLGLLHGHPQPAGDPHRRHLLVAHHLQRARHPQRRRRAGAGRAAHHALRLRGLGQRRQRPAAVDDHLDPRRRCGGRVGHRGGPAPADDTPLPGRGGGHVALAGRRRLGRLPQRDLPARRLALHAGGRPGGGLRLGRPDRAGGPASAGGPRPPPREWTAPDLLASDRRIVGRIGPAARPRAVHSASRQRTWTLLKPPWGELTEAPPLCTTHTASGAIALAVLLLVR